MAKKKKSAKVEKKKVSKKGGDKKSAKKPAAKKAAKKKVVKAAKKVKAAAKPAKTKKVAKKVKAAKSPKASGLKDTAKKLAKKISASLGINEEAPKKQKGPVPPKETSGKTKAPKETKASKSAPRMEMEDEAEEFDEEVEVIEVDASAIDEDAAAEEVILTDAEGRRYCRVRDCDQLSSVDGYCRYHYLLFWKKIQVRKKILTEGKLERYVEELTARYPDKFLDMLRKDLRSEKEFLAAIQELEIDEGNEDGDFEDEDRSFIDEVRGISDGSSRDEEEY